VGVAGSFGDQLFLNALAKFLLNIFGMIIIYIIETQLSTLADQAPLGFISKCSIQPL
jgi:hypothetical protein